MVYQTNQPKLLKTKLRRVEEYVNSQDPHQVPDVIDVPENVEEGTCDLCETAC